MASAVEVICTASSMSAVTEMSVPERSTAVRPTSACTVCVVTLSAAVAATSVPSLGVVVGGVGGWFSGPMKGGWNFAIAFMKLVRKAAELRAAAKIDAALPPVAPSVTLTHDSLESLSSTPAAAEFSASRSAVTEMPDPSRKPTSACLPLPVEVRSTGSARMAAR